MIIVCVLVFSFFGCSCKFGSSINDWFCKCTNDFYDASKKSVMLVNKKNDNRNILAYKISMLPDPYSSISVNFIACFDTIVTY